MRQPANLLRELIERRIAPVVCFGQPAADTPCLTLDHDAVAGASKAVRHLFALGYRRVALVASDRPWGELWLEGYRQALADSDVPFVAERVVRTGETRQEGVTAAATLVARGLPCDAVFTDTDLHALGVVEGLTRHGVRVPEEVGVMGYDGLDIAVNHPPHLTSLDVPHQAMIQAALKVLEKGGRVPTEPKHIAFVGDVLAGQTVVASRPSGVESPASWVPYT